MYAIVETSGRQYRVAPGQEITVDRLEAEVGDELTIDRVLLVSADDAVRVGTPVVADATVKVKVLSHDLGPKIRMFTYRRRKRSRVTKGFRASHTVLEILEIVA